jgi:hypothetical protein
MGVVHLVSSMIFLVRCELLRRRMLLEQLDLEVRALRMVRA